MRKDMLHEVEDQKAFQRHPNMPVPLPPEKDTDDYEEFDSDADKMSVLWEKGADDLMDEMLAAEDY